MEPKKLSFVDMRGTARAFQVLLGIVLLCFSGCASGNYRKADVVSDSLRDAALQIQAENEVIDVTVARLDDLVNKPAPDLKPQFKRFSASVDRLAGSARRAEKAAEVASRKSADYFRNWDKETASINFEAVRDQSVSRKTLVSNEFNTVNQRYRENQAVIEPLISYLQDIRTALSTDLTAGGVEAVRPLAENAQQNARKVQTALAHLSDDLSASGTRMSSIAPREAQPKGGVGEATETTQEHAQSSP